jgi:hypothetical protein
MTGICQQFPKPFDFVMVEVFPEKLAHMSRSGNNGRSSGHFRLHLAMHSAAHGVFKGVMKRRKTPGRKEKRAKRGSVQYMPVQLSIFAGRVER